MHWFFIATTKKKEGALHTDRPVFEFPNHTAEFPNQWLGMFTFFHLKFRHTVLPNQNKLLCWEIGWCGLSWLAWIFKSNFHFLIRPYLEKLFSKSLMKLGDRLMTSKSERQRTSGPQKRSKTDFMYCRKFTLRPPRNLVKEFRDSGTLTVHVILLSNKHNNACVGW